MVCALGLLAGGLLPFVPKGRLPPGAKDRWLQRLADGDAAGLWTAEVAWSDGSVTLRFATATDGWQFDGAAYWRQSLMGLSFTRETAQVRAGRDQLVTLRESALLARWPWVVGISLAGLLLVLSTCRVFRGSRFPPGHCPHCGYDLRATPDRCPECGRVPSPRWRARNARWLMPATSATTVAGDGPAESLSSEGAQAADPQADQAV